jgi:hypothetical protein
MEHLFQEHMDSGNSYLLLFYKAQQNLTLVCEEYKGTPLCKKGRRKPGKHQLKSLN